MPQSTSCGSLPGLQPNAVKVHQALCAQFPAISSYGGVREADGGYHSSGRAIDAMVSNQALGQAVANYVRANAGSLGGHRGDLEPADLDHPALLRGLARHG